MTTIATANQPKHVLDAVQKVTQIATLPEITVRIIQVVEDPRSTARDLHAIIKHDVALSAKILKVVNSAFYGLPRQVGSVDRAIILLGLSTVKNIAVATSITKLFRGRQLSTRYTPRDLWMHSLACGVFSKMIAEARKLDAPDEIFVTGLMHDIGLIVEMQVYPTQLGEVIDEAAEQEVNLFEVEQRVLEADHQAFGAALAVKWKFPHVFQATTGSHHDPMKNAGPFQVAAAVVHLAEALAARKEIGFTVEGGDYYDEVLDVLHMEQEHVQTLLDDFDARFSDAESTMAEEAP